MMTLCIRYTLDRQQLADFEAMRGPCAKPSSAAAASSSTTICDKVAGSDNAALGLIDFPDLAPTSAIAKSAVRQRGRSKSCVEPKRRGAF